MSLWSVQLHQSQHFRGASGLSSPACRHLREHIGQGDPSPGLENTTEGCTFSQTLLSPAHVHPSFPAGASGVGRSHIKNALLSNNPEKFMYPPPCK